MAEEGASSRKEKRAQRDSERQKKGKKRKHAETVDVPKDIPEDGDDLAKDFIPLPADAGEAKSESARQTKTDSKKRKRTTDEIEPSAPIAAAVADGEGEPAAPKAKKQKKRKKAKSATTTDNAEANEDGTEQATGEKAAKQRFIVFVGNLPYNTTDTALMAHFKSLQPFTLRHRMEPQTKRSKGFAFLEFENFDRMKTCLKLFHHSMFDPDDKELGGKGKGTGRGGRKINVELTAGGGGKTEGRKEKIRVKNVRLDEQRARRAELERKEKLKKERKEAKERGEVVEADDDGQGASAPAEEEANAGMHPSRLARLQK
ncbi:hypothetical protein MBLNU230_g6923t1 [Neophaeotheca triangularis]